MHRRFGKNRKTRSLQEATVGVESTFSILANRWVIAAPRAVEPQHVSFGQHALMRVAFERKRLFEDVEQLSWRIRPFLERWPLTQTKSTSDHSVATKSGGSAASECCFSTHDVRAAGPVGSKWLTPAIRRITKTSRSLDTRHRIGGGQ